MRIWVAVLLAGIGTFVFRFGVAAIVERITLPQWFERASSNVMPACFAGLASVALLHHGSGGPSAAVPLSAAAMLTVVVARSRPAHVAMLSGLALLRSVETVLGQLAG